MLGLIFRRAIAAVAGLLLAAGAPAFAPAFAQTETPPAEYDAELAEQLGADDYGMRSYVLVLLKTGPATIEDAEERSKLFAGHFSNMSRLAEEGKLVLAGPLDGENGMRGLFVLAVSEVEDARALVQTDPAVAAGIFAPEFHQFYGTAGLMQLNALSVKLQKKSIGE